MSLGNDRKHQPSVGLVEFRESLLESLVSAKSSTKRAHAAEERRSPSRRPRRGRRPLIGLAVATALVALALLAGTTTRGQQNAAAAVLRTAAARLDGVPVPALPAGSYWYIRTRERGLGIMAFRDDGHDRTAAALRDSVNETWLANDGSGAQYGVQGAPFALTPAGSQALAALERVEPQNTPPSGTILRDPKLISVSLGKVSLSPANLSALPTDTSLLRELIASATNNNDPRITSHDKAVAQFQAIANALFYEPFNPRLAAALYRVLATLPDVHGPTPARDALGRSGVVIAIDADQRWGLIIDPRTGRLLERTETKIKSDENDAQVPVGTVTFRQTITEAGVVSGVAVRPDGNHLDTSHWTICGADPRKANPDQGHCVDP